MLVFGHTHKPWVHTYGGVLFVNCGSVGKPKDGDPRAAFAILELDRAGAVTCAIERVPYDAEAVAREVAAAGPAGRVRRQARGGGVGDRQRGRGWTADLRRRLLAELLGSAFLAAVVIGSGIAAQRSRPATSGCSCSRTPRRPRPGCSRSS